MTRNRFIQLASVFILASAAVALPRTARTAVRLACDSGGAGSSSCSLTQGQFSCSVSCQTGNYACCNYGFAEPSCNCIHNKT